MTSKVWRWQGIALFLFLGLSVCKAHEFYVSVYELSLKDRHLNLKAKIFKDDLLLALREHHSTFGIDEEADVSSVSQLTFLLNTRFLISINNIERKWQVVDLEDTSEAIWIMATIETNGDVESMNIKLDLLTDIYDDQTNIVRLDGLGSKQFINLTKRKTEAVFR